MRIPDEFFLAEFYVEVDVCGVTYYAMLDGNLTSDESKAFKHFHRDGAYRVAARIADDHTIPQVIAVPVA